MLNTKAQVELRQELPQYSYRPTVYIGIRADNSPEEPLSIVDSVEELQIKYNTFTKSESFEFAKFILSRGFRLLVNNVSFLTGVATSRKFIVDEKDLFFSPRLDVFGEDIFLDNSINILDTNKDYGTFSEILNYNINVETLGDILVSDYAIVVPKYYGTQLDNAVCARMAYLGPWFNTDSIEVKNRINELKVTHFEIAPPSSSNDGVLEFRERFRNFLTSINLHVEQIEDTDSDFCRSNSTMYSFEKYNLRTVGGEEIVEFTNSDIGRNENYCSAYDNYKVCTLYTKGNSSINDVTVTITLTKGYYFIEAYKEDSDGAVLYSESFQYSANEESLNYITKLNSDSKLVNIKVHDRTKNLAGVYELRGRTRIDGLDDFYDSLKLVEDEGVSADMCVDSSQVSYRRTEYVEKLHNIFKNSIILTNVFTPLNRVLNIGPKVLWMNSNLILPGSSYLISLLPTEDSGSDSDIVRVLKSADEPRYDNNIEEYEYGVRLVGPTVRLKNEYPVRSLLAAYSLENEYSLKVQSERDPYQALSRSLEEVNSFYGTSIEATIESSSSTEDTLTTTLNIKIDSDIERVFRVVASVTY